MKVLITGANGQLGKALNLVFPDAVLTDSKALDISNFASIKNFQVEGFEAIINAAAYTKVDEAEKPENLNLVWAVNSQGPANLAWLAAKLNIPLVHISSDYVFNGHKDGPYTEDDLFDPLSIYGASKAAGDLAVARYKKHYIFRTSWVIGDGNNFVSIMQSLAEKGVDPSVVDDQYGRLTFADTLAEGILFALNNKLNFGTYNLTNSGDVASWFNIAREVFKLSRADPQRLSPVSSQDYFSGKQFIAARPRNSELSLVKIKASGFNPEDWRVKLERYLS
jgi:dTDP-4-dehydrorhamnose 3,5-epimerase